MRWLVWCSGLATAVLTQGAAAHVGSPEILHEGAAGPYHLLVAIAPPATIPGLAHARFRSMTPELEALDVVPLAIGQDRHAPRAERALRDGADARSYTAELWIMTPGSWKVRIVARGRRGDGELSIPVPALPSAATAMDTRLALALWALTALLAAGAIGIVGAAAREARLAPGVPVSAADRRRGRRSMLATAAGLILILIGAATWWSETARRHSALTYRPTGMTAWVDDAGRLFTQLEDPGWLTRRPDDLVADHGRLMHLYAVRVPAMDYVLHLHPDLQRPGLLVRDLPALPGGRYRLFADIVHQTGLAETAVTEISLPDLAGRPLLGDDAARAVPEIGRPPANGPTELDDGSHAKLELSEPLQAGRPVALSFTFESANGEAVTLEPYLGMLGHLAVIAHDLSVFTHVHPNGTVPMAALAVASSTRPVTECAPAAAGAGPDVPVLANGVAFPYLFPHPGGYRLILQVKRNGRILTGAFDVRVAS
jgi:hypothetical protein